MNRKEKALIILTPAFAADEHDSRLPSQELLVRHFNRLYPSLKIVILSFHFPVRHEKEYSWHGNKVITLAGNRKSKWHSLLLWKRAWQELVRLRNTYELTGLFSFFCSECAFIGHYFGRRYQLPHKIWVLGQDARKSNPQVRRIKPLPEELVVISDFLQKEFECNHGIRPAHIIPIGIDASLFSPTPGIRDIDLLGAGSLIPLKQYDQFVDVVAMVAEQYPELKAVLLGNGPEEAALKQQAAALHTASGILFPGKQSHIATLAYMQRTKLFLHTSAYEGLGMVCLEALYAGAHVISFCRPFDATIPHWHIVGNKEEMVAKAIGLLQGGTDHTAVMPYRMEDTAIRLMQSYGHEKES